jgi:hypothetical protein
MGSMEVWHEKSLVWLEGWGINHGRGKGIMEANSLVALP